MYLTIFSQLPRCFNFLNSAFLKSPGKATSNGWPAFLWNGYLSDEKRSVAISCSQQKNVVQSRVVHLFSSRISCKNCKVHLFYEPDNTLLVIGEPSYYPVFYFV